MNSSNTKVSLSHNRCIFFDRDGVVNVSPGNSYVTSWNEFHFREGICEVLKLAINYGYYCVLVTNQKGVGKGIMSESNLIDIHKKMQEALSRRGCRFNAIYSATGTPASKLKPKPDPSMVLAAAEDLQIDLRNSWLIGDADRDIEMAQNAGLRGSIRVVTENPVGVQADYTVSDIKNLLPVLSKIFHSKNE